VFGQGQHKQLHTAVKLPAFTHTLWDRAISIVAGYKLCDQSSIPDRRTDLFANMFKSIRDSSRILLSAYPRHFPWGLKCKARHTRARTATVKYARRCTASAPHCAVRYIKQCITLHRLTNNANGRKKKKVSIARNRSEIMCFFSVRSAGMPAPDDSCRRLPGGPQRLACALHVLRRFPVPGHWAPGQEPALRGRTHVEHRPAELRQ
jgi:hypothetical protein